MLNAVVSPEHWKAERIKLLEQEKELTRLKDELNQRRLNLPWVKVEKDYRFVGPDGEVGLADLFRGKSQLIVYHFMYGPDWTEGCSGCSFLADHFDGARLHLEHHDVSLVCVSRAPLENLLAYREKMEWKFPWYSSLDSDFNYDYGVSFKAGVDGEFNYRPTSQDKDEEAPGASCFFKDEDGTIYHTYSTYARGLENSIGAYTWLDIAPRGRNEESGMEWMRRHTEYETGTL